ncbi:MAG: hypothetical protein IJI11_02820, partial [Mogibacterium sp.]|nr:hypothetical protein [Mogibacterium sp.]
MAAEAAVAAAGDSEAKEKAEAILAKANDAKAAADATVQEASEAVAQAVAQASALNPAAPTVNAGDVFEYNGSTYVVLSPEEHTAALTKGKNKKSLTVPAAASYQGVAYSVTQINANAFKGKKIRTVTIGKNVAVISKNAFKKSKATKIIVKTTLLTKANVKGSLKGS